MKPDVLLLARLYCAVIAAVLIALGLEAWDAGQGSVWSGAMPAGVGLFMVAGLFGSTTRLLAMLGLCVAFGVLAFAFSLGLLVLHTEAPSRGMFEVWITELGAAAIAFVLARPLYRIAVDG